jgi:hypothetical protein
VAGGQLDGKPTSLYLQGCCQRNRGGWLVFCLQPQYQGSAGISSKPGLQMSTSPGNALANFTIYYELELVSNEG